MGRAGRGAARSWELRWRLAMKKAGLGTRKGSTLCSSIWLMSCGAEQGSAEQAREQITPGE